MGSPLISFTASSRFARQPTYLQNTGQHLAQAPAAPHTSCLVSTTSQQMTHESDRCPVTNLCKEGARDPGLITTRLQVPAVTESHESLQRLVPSPPHHLPYITMDECLPGRRGPPPKAHRLAIKYLGQADHVRKRVHQWKPIVLNPPRHRSITSLLFQTLP